MKILVTGGAGFIGSHFVDFALAQIPMNGEIVVLDKLTYAGRLTNLKSSQNDKRFSFIKGDIADPLDVERAIEGVSHVINFAAESHVDRSIENASDFINTNIVGTSVLLEASKNHGIEKFVQISTDEVYGSISSGDWTENSPLLPNSPYAASKASADLLVRAFNRTYGLHTNITRCSNNYGARQYPEKAIPVFIKNILMNKALPIYGNGENRRDWLHVTDHCKAIYLVLLGGRSGEIYNIGGGVEKSNLELVKVLLSELNASETLISFVGDRKGHDFRYSVDYEKIKKELGYCPAMSFDKGIRETIDWYRANPHDLGLL